MTDTTQKPEVAHLSRYETAGTVNIPKDVFEQMYLTPKLPVTGNLRTSFGNPTPIALAGFVVSTSSFACQAMGWRGAETGVDLIGSFYFLGGMLQIIGAIFEIILGNTFPSVVFGTLGSFWLGLGVTEQYVLGGNLASENFQASFGLFLCFMAVLSFMFLVCSLRTNMVFVFIFVFLEIAFCLLTAAYWYFAQEETETASRLQKAGGACIFVFSLAAWYLLFSVLLRSVDFPFSLPLGDLSTRFKGAADRKKLAESLA
ncbi:GPR1/FUN34/yaaH family-domain-containing protein [Aspergillus heterothallicus]